ncbi:hypothetical protein B0J14DRAFT_215803 [Halenospora varia]|nr:hypothetical protein B0J14DRAFT_215803 [Halenospora varia]
MACLAEEAAPVFCMVRSMILMPWHGQRRRSKACRPRSLWSQRLEGHAVLDSTAACTSQGSCDTTKCTNYGPVNRGGTMFHAVMHQILQARAAAHQSMCCCPTDERKGRVPKIKKLCQVDRRMRRHARTDPFERERRSSKVRDLRRCSFVRHVLFWTATGLTVHSFRHPQVPAGREHCVQLPAQEARDEWLGDNKSEDSKI